MLKIVTVHNETFYIRKQDVKFIRQYVKFDFDKDPCVCYQINMLYNESFEVENIDNLID
jgi:hypothetical protein